MSHYQKIMLDDIRVGQRLRDLDESQIGAIQQSILDIGLLNPITVYPTETVVGGANVPAWGLIAGAHRLEACRRAGYEDIAATVVDLSDLEAQLAECDENLCRAELSPADRARFVKRRKDAYEALYPETRREATLKQGEQSPSRQVGETGKPARFTADTAAKTGQSERAIQRDAERGEKVIPEAMEMVRGTKLDTGAYLDKLKRLTPNDQVTAVKRDLVEPRPVSTSRQSGGGVGARFAPAAPDTSDAFDRFIILVDRLEELPVASVIRSSGRQRSVLGQRTSSLIDRLTDLLERLDQ